MKKIFLFLFMILLTIISASCGKTEEKPTVQTKNSSVVRTADSNVTERMKTSQDLTAYQAEIHQTFVEIQKISHTIALVDKSDPKKTIIIYQEAIRKLIPLYEQLGSLQAPEFLSEQQKKIQEGVEASLELLHLSHVIFESGGKPEPSGEVDLKIQELQKKEILFRQKMDDMNAALLLIENVK